MSRAGGQPNFHIDYHDVISHATRFAQMSSAFFLKDMELEGFHRSSAEFVYPLEVGIPGRVWKHRNFAWHGTIMHTIQYSTTYEDFIIEIHISPSSLSSGLILV